MVRPLFALGKLKTIEWPSQLKVTPHPVFKSMGPSQLGLIPAHLFDTI